ncbi:MAG TPA: hypothetical protein VLL06_01990 [Nitrospiraceae bacterium]|nr:hypothetical protein [Nitrospiraceae bacterium]
MKKRIGIFCAIVLGVVFVTAGVCGEFAMANIGQEIRADFKDLKADLKELKRDLNAARHGELKGDVKNVKADLKELKGDIKGGTPGTPHSVPEPSPLILLGVGLVGLAIIELWRRRKSAI